MTLGTDALKPHFWTREPARRGKATPGAFSIRRADGRAVRDRTHLQRIAALAIPPAWTEVCISPDPEADLQAFGRDAAGRLQYRYHADYTAASAARKWQRLARFAEVLPRLRQCTAADLRRPGLPRDKVLALMTRLLHVGFFRVGSAKHWRRTRSHGLSTLHKRHLKLDGHAWTFCYSGKSGVDQCCTGCDPVAARLLRQLMALPGPWLFQCESDASDGTHRRVRAAEVNAYLRERIGPFTARDFRTWGGTLTCAETLTRIVEAGPAAPEAPKDADAAVRQAVRQTAEALGNTPAVARGSYICPVVIDHFLDGRVLQAHGASPAGRQAPGLSRSEAALSRLLRQRVGPAPARSRHRLHP